MDRARGQRDDRGTDLKPVATTDICFDTMGAHVGMKDAAYVGAGEDHRAGGPGPRHVGDAGVLLGGGWAAESTDTRADASFRVAVQVAARPPQALGAAAC